MSHPSARQSVLAESSGEIVSLSHSLGDHVSAGEEIARFENSSQQAAVLQAQGAYEAAQAALNNASGTTAQNSGVSAAQALESEQNAQTSALAALQSSYAALDDAVHTKSDPLFSNPRSADPTLAILIPDSQLIVTLEGERAALEGVLGDARSTAADGSIADIDSNAASLVASAQTVETFENNLVQAVNEAVPSQSFPASSIAGYQTFIGAARSEVVSAITASLPQRARTTARRRARNRRQTQRAPAHEQHRRRAGECEIRARRPRRRAGRPRESDRAFSDLRHDREPFVTQGDYVSRVRSGRRVISNPGALEVDTYVTSDDAEDARDRRQGDDRRDDRWHDRVHRSRPWIRRPARSK